MYVCIYVQCTLGYVFVSYGVLFSGGETLRVLRKRQ